MDVEAALERVLRRADAFEADSRRVARHALKVILPFTLLDRRRLRLDAMPAYVERIGIYREFNDTFFQCPGAELAAMLIGELSRAGVIHSVDGWLVPTERAA